MAGQDEITRRAAWWWIDRWRKSTAYTDMTLAEQGAYRNLLDELWVRGGVLPNDERILAKVSGDAIAWPTVRVGVMRHFYVTPEGLRNSTHDEVSAESSRRAQKQKDYRDRNRSGNNTGNASGNEGRNVTPSPGPGPGPSKGKGPGPEERMGPRVVAVGENGSRAILPANPLVEGRRPQMQADLLAVIREHAAFDQSKDPTEIMAEASGYEGASRAKLNPATMSDDRLAATLIDAKANLAAAKQARASPVSSARRIVRN